METVDRVFPSVMHQVYKREWNWIIILILFILHINIAIIGAKYAQTVHYVPASASPGYIVTGLSQQMNQVSHIEDSNMSELFFLNGNQLSLKAGLKQFRGQRLDVKVKHTVPDIKEWVEQVSIHIHDSDLANQFTNQPYVGYITENKPAGERVAGLEELFGDMKKFSYGCLFSLLGPDSLFFRMDGKSLTSSVSFDYEQRSSLQVTVQASCSDQQILAALTVQVLNINDNPPVFDRPVYLTTWTHYSNPNRLLIVHAIDPDGDSLIYSLLNSSMFRIDSLSGVISAVQPEAGQLQQAFSTDFEVNVSDGKHTTVAIIQVITRPLSDNPHHGEIRRHRRSVRDEIKVVVRRSDAGNLFRVASIPADRAERFKFRDPAPDGLELDSDSGLVSIQDEFIWNASISQIHFMVNITRIDNPSYNDIQPVVVQLVDRTWQDPIFTNKPQDMVTTIPVWIRPETVIYTVESIDEVEFGIPVLYQLESDSSGGCFSVDNRTGDVMIACRRQFVEGTWYELAISAQSLYAARQMATPTQVLKVHVGALAPQFYYSPYIIDMPETSNEQSRVGDIRAVSFQQVPLKFSIVKMDDASTNVFSLHQNGQLYLLKKLRHVSDPQQYKMEIKVKEEYTNLETSTQLIVNLIGENIHTPFFPARFYVVRNIEESRDIGSEIMRVRAVDIDQGKNGWLTFQVDNDHFSVETDGDGKTAIIRVAKRLDYDFTELHRYQFTLSATDGGEEPRKGFTQVQVWLDNVKDEKPVMEPPVQVVRVKEDAIQGLRIHTVQAFDPDGDSLIFTFGGGVLSYQDFKIDRVTGAITLQKEIGPGTGDLDLPILVSDGSQLTQGQVKVKFIGVNHPPRFPDCDSYTGRAQIAEEEPGGSLVLDITVIDDDSGENGDLTFKVVVTAAQEKSLFHIGNVTHTNDVYRIQLLSSDTFDHENPMPDVSYVNGKQNYKVTVLAEDSGTPKLAASCFLFVEIKDINDKVPRFDLITYNTIIMRNIARNKRVVRVFAVDDDDGTYGIVKYRIDSQDENCQNCFLIDENTGWITRSGSGSLHGLEQVTLKIAASDGEGKSSTVHDVIIDITDDESELAPVFLPINGQSLDDIVKYVEENITETTDFLQVFTNKNALPSVQNGRTLMENSRRNFDRKPGYNATSMIVRAKGLDYTQVTEYSVRLRAATRVATEGTRYTDARVKVKVIDVNDKTPVFEGLDDNKVYPAAVTEKTRIGDLVVKVTAIDADGTEPNNKVSYRFLRDECADCAAFRINSRTGEITAAQTFDPGEVRSYILRVVAEDGAPSSSGTGRPNRNDIDVTVKVTGPSLNPPYFPANLPIYNLNLDEGVPINHTVTDRIKAVDPLPGDNVIQYIIVGGNEDRRFACDSKTGRIYTVGEIKYSDKSAYTLVFGVFDGIQVNTTNLHIRIMPQNIYPPDFTNLNISVTSVTENEPISSSKPKLLTKVSATDPDARPSRITYSLEGDYYQPDRFAISPDGSVYLKQPLDRDYPDGTDDWLLNVVASDTGPGGSSLSSYGMLHLRLRDVNDNAPMFNSCCTVGEVPENSNSNAFVMQLSAFDYDAGSNGDVRYEKGDDWPQTEEGNDLLILTNDGLISTALSGSLDRETKDTYTATVRAIDRGIPSKTVEQQIEIKVQDINDNSPVFSPSRYVYYMPEELPVGASVMPVFASDADVGENARLVYSIQSAEAAKYFYLDSLYSAQSGLIRILERIDYDSRNSYTMNFTVRVRDINPQHTDTAQVSIVIVDINDNAPVFLTPHKTVNITENKRRANIATFPAKDIDSGLNSQFEYFIDYELSDDIDHRFEITRDTGVISLRTALDRETKPLYYVHVLAVDKGTPPMTGTATLTVYVGDENDNAPDIGAIEPTRVVVGTDTRAGDEVFRFQVDDPDLGDDSTTISYICNNAKCREFDFRQISSQGKKLGIVSAKKSGYTSAGIGTNSYDLTFELKDKAGLKRRRVVPVHIEGDPAARYQPGTSYITVYNYKAQLHDTEIGQVYCQTDDNNWTPKGKEFSASGGSYAYFNILKNGSIIMRRGAPRGNHTLEVNVVHTVTKQSTVCRVKVTIYYLFDDAFQSSGSLRIQGTTAEDFIKQPSVKGQSKYFELQAKLAVLLETEPNYVEIFGVRDVEDADQPTIDVYYAAHGSPYYRSARLNGLVWANKNNLLGGGLSVIQAPVSPCHSDPCYSGGCQEDVVTSGEAHMVRTSRTTFIGLDVSTLKSCQCASGPVMGPDKCQINTCLNNGTCTETYAGFKCWCLPGFEGPRCEQTKISFSGNGWAWYKTLAICDKLKLSFEFMTRQATALLLYNGPMYVPGVNDTQDFISVELFGGYPRARINTGASPDVLLHVSGKNGKGQKTLSELNDGRWHTLELFKDGLEYKFVVDHCQAATIKETINSTEEDRLACESVSTSTSTDHFLTLNTPLELGGRSKSINYPTGLAANSFKGCMKNLWVNGQLYDLRIDRVGQAQNAEDGCPSERCDLCPGNSSCIGTLTGNPVCQCLPGYSGDGCDIETPLKDFRSDESYIEWRLSPRFNKSLSLWQESVELSFRTRQSDGILFYGDSFSTLERISVEISSNHLQVRYDLGDGDNILVLPDVNVSDGQWHDISISRYGNQMILKLDNGDGDHYAEAWPKRSFRLLALDGSAVFGAAQVSYNPWSGEAYVKKALPQTCIKDVRYQGELFPMDEGVAGDLPATVARLVKADDLCESEACAGIMCPFGSCVDVWREHMCMCDIGMIVENDMCVIVNDCSLPRCVNGDCVMIDEKNSETWRCNCYDGFQGPYCNGTIIEPGAATAGATTGMIVAVVISLLVLLLVILVIIIFMKRRRPTYLLDDPDDDIRETVRNYDEEGAGEEDTHGYDLSRLPKPVDHGPTYRPDGPDRPYVRVDEPPIPEPEAMPPTRSRPPFPHPSEYPNVGDFIDDRLADANNDPNAPPYDSVREYEYEGGGSTAGSLSSLQSSSSGDQDFDYLNGLGPPFRKLADMYAGGNDED